LYDNNVRLMGFIGKDAVPRKTGNGKQFVVLSLATAVSWKDEHGQYTDKTKRTDWHSCIAWSNLSKFASTLKKGAHIEVEGELRYRKVADSKKKDVVHTVAEIHLSKILKLDRAERRGGDENFPPELDNDPVDERSAT
jgi:single-strand DNA-binding protein